MDNILKFCEQIEDDKFLNTQKLKECASRLMGEFRILKGDAYYQIAEIEFYYYSSQHPDIITYPREGLEKKWFFHQSGVDITIKSDKEKYGGILIRSIIRQKDGKRICGPQKCVDELFNFIDIQGKDLSIIPRLEFFGHTDVEVVDTQRYIPFYIRKNEVSEQLKKVNDEKEAYKLIINKKVKNKYDSIKNRATLSEIATEDVFKKYLSANYRFYLKCLESTHEYKYCPNPFAKDDYKYLFKAI